MASVLKMCRLKNKPKLQLVQLRLKMCEKKLKTDLQFEFFSNLNSYIKFPLHSWRSIKNDEITTICHCI